MSEVPLYLQRRLGLAQLPLPRRLRDFACPPPALALQRGRVGARVPPFAPLGLQRRAAFSVECLVLRASSVVFGVEGSGSSVKPRVVFGVEGSGFVVRAYTRNLLRSSDSYCSIMPRRV